jgi:hypothetical protein
MLTCFKCGVQSPAEMTYCLECGDRIDGEQETGEVRLDPEPETFIRNMHPVQPTFVGTLPRPRSRRKLWALMTFGTGLLTVLAVYFYIGQQPPVNSTETLPEIRSAMGRAQDRAVVTAVQPKKVKPLPSLPALVNITDKTAPAVQTAPTVLRRPTPTTAKAPQPMQVRIEIIDGVEQCFAIPGGRRIPCS